MTDELVERILTDEETAEFQPTLIIGLGGTGKKVLTELKARIFEEFEEWPSNVRLVELDIDPFEEVAYIGDQAVSLNADEFFDLGDVPAGGIRHEIRGGKYPEIASWFSSGHGLVEDNLRLGGQKFRQLGRLAFFWHLSRAGRYLFNELERVISDLTPQSAIVKAGAGSPGVRRTLTVRVFVVSSLCGGTGSGMFIDVAYILREILRQRGQQDALRMVAILVTPKVFRGALQPTLRPNALAALQELDYFMTTKPEHRKFEHISYLENMKAEARVKPYDLCYLVDAITKSGYNLEGVDRIVPMIVDGLFVMALSRIGMESESKMVNVDALKEPSFGTVYSTFGVASLVFPARQIADICGMRVARDVLKAEFLATGKKPPSAEVEDDLKRFITNHALTQTEIFRALRENRENGRSRLNPLATLSGELSATSLKRLTRDRYGMVISTVENGMPRLLNEAQSALTAEVAAVQQSIINTPEKGLRERVRDLVNTPDKGPQYALEFVNLLLGKLISLEKELSDKQQQIERGLPANQNSAVHAAAELRTAADRHGLRALFSFLHGSKISPQDYVDRNQVFLDRQFEREVYAGARKIIEEVRTESEKLVKGLKNFFGTLEWIVKEDLAEREKRAWKEIKDLEHSRRYPVVETSHIEEIYKEQRADGYNRLIDLLYGYAGGLSALSKLEKQPLSQEIARAAHNAFPGVKRIGVEDMIQRRQEREGIRPQDWLQFLRKLADLFWPYKPEAESSQGRQSMNVSVIGVRDENSIYRTGEKLGESFASTGNDYSLTVLSAEHGFTYKTMAQYESYMTDLTAALQRGTPVYVYPEFDYGTTEEQMLFAQAWGLGFIVQKARMFSIDSLTGIDPDKKVLSRSGLGDALWRFAQEDSIRQAAQSAIDSKIQASDIKTLAKELRDFAEKTKLSGEDQALVEVMKARILQFVQRELRA